MRYHNHQNIAAWVDDLTFETVESLRWPIRMSRSEFVRRAITFYIETLKTGLKANHRHVGSKHGSY